MGQNYKLYNPDKKEYVHPRRIDSGAKLMEQCGFEKSTATALWLLLANSNGRGGGDASAHPMVGRWAGDRIVVQGDYAGPTDPGYISAEEADAFTDISKDVKALLDAEFGADPAEEEQAADEADPTEEEEQAADEAEPGKLTAARVDEIFQDCLFDKGEPTQSHVAGHGVQMTAGFHPDRLAGHKAEIAELLQQLPDGFHTSGGGGASFLNACETRDGVQWGEHRNVDQLLMLGNATGLTSFLMPRARWGAFPGGMPYFVVKSPVPA